MPVPSPPTSVAALASFLRDRLAEFADTLTSTVTSTVTDTVTGTVALTVSAVRPVWRGRDGAEVVTTLRGDERRVDAAVLTAARQFTTTVVGATAPFAGSSYARMRLIRQMHASGLLTAEQAHRIDTVLHERDRDVEPVGAPRRPRPGAARPC